MIKHNRLTINAWSTLFLLAATSASLTACSLQQYTPKPLDPTKSVVAFERNSPTDAQFEQYLLNNGYTVAQLPIKQWNLDALTYCALFFHPSLNVARAQWRAAETAELAAATKTLPTINGHLAHSDDEAKKPFAFGLSIDIPIESNNKRDIRIENARHLSQAAKLEIAQTAWQLRNNIAQTRSELQFNFHQINVLDDERALRQEIVSLFQKRVDVGAASNVELSAANLQLQAIQTMLNTTHDNKRVLQAKLAGNLGLPLEKVTKMQLEERDSVKQTVNIPTANLRNAALLNRLDIRIALERYAAAEAKLKLEIAKQQPDIIISPGYAFDFGDNVWSLGVSSLLQFLNKNKLGIAEATQLREVEAAQFEALQAQVVLDANIAHTEVMQATYALQNKQQLQTKQNENTQRMARKLAAGEADRLEFTYAKLENIAAEKNVILAHFQLMKSLDQLENTLQIPLTGMGIKES
ncbi:MAG: TolC family protein [Methylotenera sp.]